MTLEKSFPRNKTSVGVRDLTPEKNSRKSSEGSECGTVVSGAFCLISWQRKSYRSKTLTSPTVEHLRQSTRKHIKQISPVKMSVLEISATTLENSQNGEMYIYSECGESLIRKSQLTEDERIHWGEKLHVSVVHMGRHIPQSLDSLSTRKFIHERNLM
ncbi:hypothetical protein GH733_017215 [Mirounga leonina]|nr:hypothetical protein GH733_017215 [Mirounga leonina]